MHGLANVKFKTFCYTVCERCDSKLTIKTIKFLDHLLKKQSFECTIFEFPCSIRQLYTIIHSADISQATYQFNIILNKYCMYYGIPNYRNIICTALHLVLNFEEIGLMMVIWPKHAVIMKWNKYCCVWRKRKKIFYFVFEIRTLKQYSITVAEM
jgi:hypothetical protein